MVADMALLVATVWVNPPFFVTSPCEKYPFQRTLQSFSWNKRYTINVFDNIAYLLNTTQIIGDDTLAIDSVLKADVWRDHLLKEEKSLNELLTGLEKENDEKRFEDAREEASSRLAEVHARLSEMEAESGPARAAALLAGLLDLMHGVLSISFGF